MIVSAATLDSNESLSSRTLPVLQICYGSGLIECTDATRIDFGTYKKCTYKTGNCSFLLRVVTFILSALLFDNLFFCLKSNIWKTECRFAIIFNEQLQMALDILDAKAKWDIMLDSNLDLNALQLISNTIVSFFLVF